MRTGSSPANIENSEGGDRRRDHRADTTLMRPTISQLESRNLDGLGKAAETARANAASIYSSAANCSRAMSEIRR
ncbi:hypothetical protein NMK54_09995 [Nocardia otitidiscaviarum]|uniref:hypothetical protein n=1 Tax=Nocardia otitidiscaviarum TaxID=1823 RepID=UPI00163D6EBD|nr:hypothetical protein [Nocardia otitidiscaviarum]MCP9620485.1 hypothetical protein [Nocardia otitidiscaviarum]